MPKPRSVHVLPASAVHETLLVANLHGINFASAHGAYAAQLEAVDLVHKLLEVLGAILVLLHPGLGELAALDLLEDLPHVVLDAIVDYLPSPVDVPPVIGHRPFKEDEHIERKPDDAEPFSALAFKIMSDPYVGRLTYLRVYSGVLSSGNTARAKTNSSRCGSG